VAKKSKELEDILSPLLKLPEEKLNYLNGLIFKDNKLTYAAKILQEDYGLFSEYKPPALRVYLLRYREKGKDDWFKFNLDKSVHVNEEIPKELKKDVPEYAGDVVKLSQWVPYGKVKILLEEAVVKFDAMQELERVLMIQYERVIKAMEYESKLPSQVKNSKGVTVNTLGLDKNVRPELELLNNMLKNLINLQMDLGIRHKVELAQNHLHVNLDPHQQKLLKDFNNMKVVSDITTKALELITSTSESSS